MLDQIEKEDVIGLYVILAMGLVTYLLTDAVELLYASLAPGVFYSIYSWWLFFNKKGKEVYEVWFDR